MGISGQPFGSPWFGLFGFLLVAAMQTSHDIRLVNRDDLVLGRPLPGRQQILFSW